MKLNPEPGTPLPWHVFGRQVGGPDFVRVADTYASERSREAQDANALYLVHAANLYPELVERLDKIKQASSQISIVVLDDIDRVKEATLDAEITKARAILAKCETP